MHRDKLTEAERRKLQREYHKGMEAQKRVIKDLFGQDVTYSSGMAYSNSFVNSSRMKEFAGLMGSSNPFVQSSQITGPYSDMTEPEFWEWSCRAAWQGVLWAHRDFGNAIPFWVSVHRQYAGFSFRIRERDAVSGSLPMSITPLKNTSEKETHRLLVPEPIPHTLHTRMWQAGRFVVVNSIRPGTAIVVAVVTLLLERTFAG